MFFVLYSPICLSNPVEPFCTPCGHTFCYECISRHLDNRQTCPTCSVPTRLDSLKPQQDRVKQPSRSNGDVGELWSIIGQCNDPEMIKRYIEALQEKQVQCQRDSVQAAHRLLIDFLRRARDEKEEQIRLLSAELDTVNRDMSSIEARMGPAVRDGLEDSGDITDRKQRLSEHFAEFEDRYFSFLGAQGPERERELGSFGDDISRFSRYSSLSCVSTLRHHSRSECSTGTGESRSVSNIVSSIEFDSSAQYVATAGVMKCIKIFALENILSSSVNFHYGDELETKAKLSCLSWNQFIRTQLISSDYQGVITLYDVQKGGKALEFDEHESRAWSVDFSTKDPYRFASGSDDRKVKIWSTFQPSSVATIESRAQVCCVKFNPESENEIAFGSADHDVHVYDIRYTRQPRHVFRGHGKAVSYVRFLSGTQLCSASTDSTLKMWDVRSGKELRTFRGHRNEKNFVGLSVTKDLITCGSENNAVYAYFRALSRPILVFSFNESHSTLGGEELAEDSSQFVSSVCWNPKDESQLFAANSQGIIKVLKLR
mmetsp:Transcript_4168/g.8045  ORF Transcript_4168/g.8045 Transcript_4168/m.8045 type:complete len:543 (-) Transcript_4168:796-2424(-)